MSTTDQLKSSLPENSQKELGFSLMEKIRQYDAQIAKFIATVFVAGGLGSLSAATKTEKDISPDLPTAERISPTAGESVSSDVSQEQNDILNVTESDATPPDTTKDEAQKIQQRLKEEATQKAFVRDFKGLKKDLLEEFQDFRTSQMFTKTKVEKSSDEEISEIIKKLNALSPKKASYNDLLAICDEMLAHLSGLNDVKEYKNKRKAPNFDADATNHKEKIEALKKRVEAFVVSGEKTHKFDNLPQDAAAMVKADQEKAVADAKAKLKTAQDSVKTAEKTFDGLNKSQRDSLVRLTELQGQLANLDDKSLKFNGISLANADTSDFKERGNLESDRQKLNSDISSLGVHISENQIALSKLSDVVLPERKQNVLTAFANYRAHVDTLIAGVTRYYLSRMLKEDSLVKKDIDAEKDSLLKINEQISNLEQSYKELRDSIGSVKDSPQDQQTLFTAHQREKEFAIKYQNTFKALIEGNVKIAAQVSGNYTTYQEMNAKIKEHFAAYLKDVNMQISDIQQSIQEAKSEYAQNTSKIEASHTTTDIKVAQEAAFLPLRNQTLSAQIVENTKFLSAMQEIQNSINAEINAIVVVDDLVENENQLVGFGANVFLQALHIQQCNNLLTAAKNRLKTYTDLLATKTEKLNNDSVQLGLLNKDIVALTALSLKDTFFVGNKDDRDVRDAKLGTFTDLKFKALSELAVGKNSLLILNANISTEEKKIALLEQEKENYLKEGAKFRKCRNGVNSNREQSYSVSVQNNKYYNAKIIGSAKDIIPDIENITAPIKSYIETTEPVKKVQNKSLQAPQNKPIKAPHRK